MTKKTTLFLRLLLGLAVIFGAWILVRGQYLPLEELTPNVLRDRIQAFGRLASVAYVAAYVVNTVSVFPPITPLSLTSGLAFGIFKGGVLLLAAAMAGTTLSFFISRFSGRAFIEKAAKGRLRDLDKKLEVNGFMTVLFLRLIPVVPYAVFNYCCGLSKIRFRDYFLATFLGLLPVVFINSTFGHFLAEAKTPGDLFSSKFLVVAGLTSIGIVAPFLIKMARSRIDGRRKNQG